MHPLNESTSDLLPLAGHQIVFVRTPDYSGPKVKLTPINLHWENRHPEADQASSGLDATVCIRVEAETRISMAAMSDEFHTRQLELFRNGLSRIVDRKARNAAIDGSDTGIRIRAKRLKENIALLVDLFDPEYQWQRRLHHLEQYVSATTLSMGILFQRSDILNAIGQLKELQDYLSRIKLSSG